MYHSGNCPWMVWDPERSGAEAPLVVDPQQSVEVYQPASRRQTEPPAAKLFT
jgi:hypothetical protein